MPWQAQEVLREEDQVHADERDPEVERAQPLAVLHAPHLLEPVVEAREDREHGAQAEHVVEVGDHVVGVVEAVVDAGVGQHDAGDAAHGEQEDEADRPQHGRLEVDRAAPHRGDPENTFTPVGHRDDHGRGHEVGPQLDAMPTVYMWWAHTTKPMKPMATMA
jgi:hypothetical protein